MVGDIVRNFSRLSAAKLRYIRKTNHFICNRITLSYLLPAILDYLWV